MPKKSGFTLIELMIVISIIAILSVVGMVIYSGVQKNGRDARRRADIDAIANALESKKAPGAIYYSTITDADMSSGNIPLDPFSSSANINYHIRLYTTSDGARLEANPTISDWSGAYPTNDSTQGGSVFWIANVGGDGSNGFGSVRFQANTNKSWKLCAKLEAGSIYCKNSTQ